MSNKKKKYIIAGIGILFILGGIGSIGDGFFTSLLTIIIGIIIFRFSMPAKTKDDTQSAKKKATYPSATKAKSKKKTYEYTKARKLVDDIIVLDFETTGFDPTANEIIQIGAIKYYDGLEVDRFSQYIKPSKPISQKITSITGITNDMVKDAPSIDMVLDDLKVFLGKETIVAHNASFDMKFLLKNFDRHNITYDRYRVIDTLSLSRKHINETDDHKLPTLKKFLKIEAESHDAIEDCIVTSQLYYYCKKVQEAKAI